MEKKAKELIDALSSGPVLKYLSENEHANIRDIVLKHKEILGIPTNKLFEQIALRKKAREKLPLYYATDGIIYPPQQNFEQTSSEHTALFKSRILATLKQNPIVADLTGGFGVDTFFISRNAMKVFFVEPDKELLTLARHNHELLDARNIEYHNDNAEEFLRQTSGPFDIVYADPSRRSNEKKRVMLLTDSAPDIVALSVDILKKSTWLLVKASPLLDIKSGLTQLTAIRKVFVVSVKNECKEVLFLSEREFEGAPEIDAVNILDDLRTESFSFSFSDEAQLQIEISEPSTYLYEPNSSILKAGAFKSIAHRFSLKKVQSSTHLFTSDTRIEAFPGRVFQVEAFIRPEKASIRKHFPEGKANVTTRNYPLTSEQLKKKTGLKDGGDKFLIGFSGEKKKFLAVATKL